MKMCLECVKQAQPRSNLKIGDRVVGGHHDKTMAAKVVKVFDNGRMVQLYYPEDRCYTNDFAPELKRL